jgi:hypothetical protein
MGHGDAYPPCLPPRLIRGASGHEAHSAEVILERLRTRTNNPYGKQRHEVAGVLHNLQTVEPLLRRVAGHEIDTSAPLDDVVATVVQLARPTNDAA